MSRAKISAPWSASGLPSSISFWASPSTIAVLPDAGLAHEDRVVLAPPAQHLERASHLADAADHGVELAAPGALGQVGGVGGERVARRPLLLFVLAGRGRLASFAIRLAGRSLAHAVRDVVQHVEARDAVRRQQLHGVRARLAQERRQHVADAGFVLARALHVDDGRLQHAAEGERLLRRPARVRRQPLHRLLQEIGELAPQPRHVHARGLEDLLALGVVRRREQQVLHRQVGVPAHHRLACRQVQDALERRAEHRQASSIPARSGKPSARAESWTASTLVSATSKL